VSRARKAFVKGVKVSEREGAGEWTAERLSSLVLVPLALWGLWSGWVLAGQGYETALDWFSNWWNSGLLILTHVIIAWHMAMGMTVIIDDYIHKPVSRNTLVALNNLFCMVLAAAGVFLIVRLALGSAPLPAGLGA
jgi:succinate dehydrogenase / fumarate reductase membrane anchor subunit